MVRDGAERQDADLPLLLMRQKRVLQRVPKQRRINAPKQGCAPPRRPDQPSPKVVVVKVCRNGDLDVLVTWKLKV